MKKCQSNENKIAVKTQTIRKMNSFSVSLSLPLFASLCVLIINFIACQKFSVSSPSASKNSAQNNPIGYEKAVYAKQDFFGQEAFVTLPTRTVQENLTALLASRPDDPQILEKLADANEKLEKFDEAETNLKHLAEIDGTKSELLMAFYSRRGAYEKQAATLEKMLNDSPPNVRPALFERLIDLARIHELREYLNSDFYTRIAQANSDIYPVFEKLIDNFSEEKDYQNALEFVRLAKSQFPEQKSVLLNKEIEILLAAGRKDEAEKVYQAAFDPFWSDQEAQKFYYFLSDRNRLRAYGGELKARFKKNPADFETAIRFALYRNYDYSYGNNGIAPIILQLEMSKKDWTTDELVTVTRLLLKKNEGAIASRFLYTLFLQREDFKARPDLRAKVLYQLFEMFSDAESEKLPISKGDLRFYKDIARSDSDPGITTGILSLIFSDSNPRQKLDEQEKIADRHFNRAAAFRVFEEYKKEFASSSASPELAQMYLDLVRLYAATGKPDFAGKILDEFTAKFDNSPDYSSVAVKLAAAFTAANQEEKARAMYQKILDYLGKQNGALSVQAKSRKKNSASFDNLNDTAERSFSTLPNDDDGINIPKLTVKSDDNDGTDYEKAGNFHDYLTRKNLPITYADILEKLVASLAAEKKTADILAIYSSEIQKHPAEEWLYEKRLDWLEQTNLTEEALAFYKTALARFPSAEWRDKLARFFVREKRKEEFAAFSESLIGSLKDREVEDYLTRFAANSSSPNDFDTRLNLKLYQAAHERFPHRINFVQRLLSIYKTDHQDDKWRSLAAEYYFESAEVRQLFLEDLAEKNELRNALQNSQDKTGIIYDLFRADAAAHLSNFENAVAAYRHLNEIYPHTPEFSERLISLTRSFGQNNRTFLNEAFTLSKSAADYEVSSAAARTRSGEISAELGDYKTAHSEWEKLIPQAVGNRQNYLNTAAVYWDFFQYADALRTIDAARAKFSDPALYAFEAGAILEAQHKDEEAIREYVKALDSATDRDEQKERAEKHLAKLVFLSLEKSNKKVDKQNSPTAQTIEKVFQSEKSKRKNSSALSLAYAEFLIRIKQPAQAAQILDAAVSQSSDEEFLQEAQSFYQTNEMKRGEQNILRMLITTAKTPRQKIQFNLQLAQNLTKDRQREAAHNILSSLIENFPTNFGVVTETSDIDRHLGYDDDAIRVLTNALPKAKGYYRSAIARKLSAQLIRLNKLDEAEKILASLYEEDTANLDIFNRLSEIYVRLQDVENLKRIFAEAIKSVKESGDEKRDIDEHIAQFRGRMINAFTQLKDYQSAIEQYIEIINRDPDDEQTTGRAIRYVKRYGGAETLLSYYQKTAAENFKNYRWNVVLARIYLANDDAENALKNYQAAIVNQPEMPELYLAIAEIETQRGNYDKALKNLDEVLTLSGNAPEYVKKKIEILKKAGRSAEIAAEKAKLPANKNEVKTDEFAVAREMANTERKKSLKIFRAAFEKLLADPLSGGFKASDITAYTEAARAEESLALINKRLWNLRSKLKAVAEAENSVNAGEAKQRLQILDGAIIEAVGTIAKTVATDEELSALHADLDQKIINAPANQNGDQILSLIQNLSRRAGFGDLEENILLKKMEASGDQDNRRQRLQNLLDFYNRRGAYQKSLEIAQKYASNNFSLLAETARLAGNSQKELEALRAIYKQPSIDSLSDDAATNKEKVARYLEILDVGNRSELKLLIKESSVYQTTLINFLIGKGEKSLAHQAIENSEFSDAWKAARGAEVSLALKEYDDTAECYFCDAMRFASIGEMIAAPPDKTSFLINDDWFRLTREYGEWLKDKSSPDADDYLPAMTENQPKNLDEQLKLGEFYLQRKEYQKAISHLKLAVETENLPVPDKKKATGLGAALYLSGEKNEAEKLWSQIFENIDEGEEIPVALIYFQTLQKYDLGEEGRKPLPPLIVKFLAVSNADNSDEFQNLIRALALSFKDERAKAQYFEQILKLRPTDKSLAAMLLNENLIAPENAGFFYQRLIEKNPFDNFAYDFAAVKQRVWSRDDAEIIYDQENNYEDNESGKEEENIDSSDGEAWRRKYLDLLIKRGENLRAAEFIEKTEKEIGDDAPRPAWLRLAKIRFQIRAGKFDPATTEKFIGIRLPDSATEIKPPNIKRFNKVLQMFKEENRADFGRKFSEAFYARNLALDQFDATNFTGLARIIFERGKTTEALNILRLLTEANDEEQRASALGEISRFEIVKTFLGDDDAIKLSADKTDQATDLAAALNAAADAAFEFGQKNEAIKFRRQLLNAAPDDWTNKISLAKLLLENSASKTEGIGILTEVSNNRNALRVNRWQARMLLSQQGKFSFSGAADYDALAQFYLGLNAAQTNQNEQAVGFFIKSLIDDQDNETSVRQELIKAFIATGKNFAAVKFAETDRSAKSDELLRILAGAAEKIEDFQKASEYEKSRSDGGDKQTLARLEKLAADKNRRVGDLIVDEENTRKL